MAQLARTPEPPYYAVIFSSLRTDTDPDGYEVAAERMVDLSRTMPGFLGLESTRGADGLGITVSYWDSEKSIRNWQVQAEHLQAQAKGRSDWYDCYELRVCRVERTYGFRRGE